MRAPISVIVPAFNAETTLGLCLQGLMEGLEAGLIRELIVCDAGSTDATVEVAKDWGAYVAASLGAAGAMAKGEWSLILNANSVLQSGWSAPVGHHLQTKRAGWIPIASEQGGVLAKLSTGWTNLRARMGHLSEQHCVLIPRVIYEQVGGYPDDDHTTARLKKSLKNNLLCIDALAFHKDSKLPQ